METIELGHDTRVFYVTASSFPDGIPDAHARLQKRVPVSGDRNYFGLSRPEGNGPIVYRAAAEEKFAGEAEQYQCDTIILKKGMYRAITLQDFRTDPTSITRAFQKILATEGLDPEGYCVEYGNDREEVTCMIRLSRG